MLPRWLSGQRKTSFGTSRFIVRLERTPLNTARGGLRQVCWEEDAVRHEKGNTEDGEGSSIKNISQEGRMKQLGHYSPGLDRGRRRCSPATMVVSVFTFQRPQSSVQRPNF